VTITATSYPYGSVSSSATALRGAYPSRPRHDAPMSRRQDSNLASHAAPCRNPSAPFHRMPANEESDTITTRESAGPSALDGTGADGTTGAPRNQPATSTSACVPAYDEKLTPRVDDRDTVSAATGARHR